MNKVSGIYGIRSLSHPERVYIGSAINIKRRFNEHRSNLSLNKHGSPKLQHHYNKHGLNDLTFEVIVKCEKQDLIKAEQMFIDLYHPWFNICVTAGNRLGMRHTEKTKAQIRLAKSNTSQETIEKIRKAALNRSPESHERMSKAQVGNKNRAKLTINLETGIFYDTIKEAAASTNIKHKTLELYLSGRLKNKTMFTLA
jgi:group I intron endonuclease